MLHFVVIYINLQCVQIKFDPFCLSSNYNADNTGSSLIYSMADCNCSYLNMMFVIIACQDWYHTYDDGSHYLGICELQFNRTALLLTSDKPTILVSSLNPPSCEAYMTNISCTVSLTSQPGQKVHVSIGNHYTLANHQCQGK